MKKLLLIFLLSVYFVKSFSQIVSADGYIITNNNDTISGNLEYFSKGYADRCNMVKAGSKTIEYFRPSQIKGYHIVPNLTYQTFTYNGKKHLMRLVSQGKLDLYNYHDNLFIPDGIGNATKLLGGEKKIQVNGTNYTYNTYGYKIQLKQLITDSTLHDEIDELPFDQADITQFVRKYNDEPGRNYSILLIKKNQKNFGILAGYTNSRFLIDEQFDFMPGIRELLSGSRETKHDKKISIPFIGANFKLHLGEESSFLNFGINVEIASKKSFNEVWLDLSDTEVAGYTGVIPLRPPGGSVFSLHNEIIMNATSINIPVTYRRILLFGQFRPYVDLGFTSRIFPSHNGSLTQVINEDNELYHTITDKPSLDLLYSGLRAGTGINYVINMNNTISGGLNFDYCFSVLEEVVFTQLKSIGFYVNYSFREF